MLITAALAACNRHTIPSQPASGYATDSTLAESPEYEEDSTCQVYYYPPDYPPGVWLGNWPFDVLNNLQYIRWRGTMHRTRRFIPRGGFGKSSHSAST